MGIVLSMAAQFPKALKTFTKHHPAAQVLAGVDTVAHRGKTSFLRADEQGVTLLVFSSCPLYSYESRKQKPRTAADTLRLSVIIPPSKIGSPLGESIFDRGVFLSEIPDGGPGLILQSRTPPTERQNEMRNHVSAFVPACVHLNTVPGTTRRGRLCLSLSTQTVQ